MRKWIGLFFPLIMFSCETSMLNRTNDDTLFNLLAPSKTGITFSNNIEESHESNIINYQDFYSGGGVSIGDINNDGLADIFFTGNMVQNKLYLNRGKLQFQDITRLAGILEKDYTWCTGSTMIDVNNDGWLDIYVSYSGLVPEEQRKNKLWINQQDNTFVDEAQKYGIDHGGYAVNANFFDYDRDGDLDMYLVNQGPEKNPNFNKTVDRNVPNEYCGDKLYRNDNGKFTDVTLEAGMYSSLIGFGHGAAVGDVNNDGWEDLYVCNDFFEHDYLYINNRDGTFREMLKRSIKHTSNFSMGNDMADFNNDGLLDIMVLDMVAEDNRRQKSMMSGMNTTMFWRAYRQGYHYQYMYNTLQLNNGDTTFSEIGHLAGVSHTDWSWGPLLADFDNDGYKDLFISNGLRKDIRNRDWAQLFNDLLEITSSYELFSKDEWDKLLNALPSEKIPNYIYKNDGSLKFQHVTDQWGMGKPSFSNGAAYGDLDNDGDLDLVVNNIDDLAFVFENLSSKKEDFNYLKIKLKGPPGNLLALGTKICITHGRNRQIQQFYLTRGYRSSMEPIVHFGCGPDSIVQRLEIFWPDDTYSELLNISTNQEILIDYYDIKPVTISVINESDHKPFDRGGTLKIDSKHRENNFDPYQYQPLLPYRLSELGPSLEIADVNGDGLQDLFIGGPYGKPGHLLIQDGDGTFYELSKNTWELDRMHEDMGVAFFDVENDGDQDLYIVSGGYEFEEGNEVYLDRLYINDGAGNFERSTGKIPSIVTSGGKVVPQDFDKDGDTDLLVLGRQIPHKYPLPADSHILRNEQGVFTDETKHLAPELQRLGMATDAVWSDIDRDGDTDLLIVGEWMKITFFQNKSGRFEKVNLINGLENSSGWWYCIEKFDFDRDGDDDFVAGNLGLNYRYKTSLDYPFQVYSKDFDSDGKQDIVMAYFEHGNLYPLENLERSTLQIPGLRDKFPKHDQFAEAVLHEVYGETGLNEALNYKVNTFETSYIENLGEGKFEIKPLPIQAQISCTDAIIIEDFDQDKNADILIAGNLYSSEEETIRNDAGIGLLLLGDGKGGFNPIPSHQSGFFADGNVKDMKLINIRGTNYVVIVRNSDDPSFLKVNDPQNHDF